MNGWLFVEVERPTAHEVCPNKSFSALGFRFKLTVGQLRQSSTPKTSPWKAAQLLEGIGI
jgi:hypothetical protein